MILAVAVFIAVSFALGLLIYGRLKEFGVAEAPIMSIIFGVCIFPLMGILLSSAGALEIYTVAGISLLVIASYIGRVKADIFGIVSDCFRLSGIEKIMMVFAIVMFIVFSMGGFSAQWLEDGDPNGHAVAASYIAHYHTYSKPADLFVARYMEPYPVGYQLWMGLLSQDGLFVNQTLKVFNYVFICLGLVAFFYLVKVLSGNEWVAGCSSFILLVLPSFSTRFIFSQSLAITQVIMVMYLIACAIRRSEKFWCYAGLVLASLFLTHPTTSAIMGGFVVIWFAVDWLATGKFNNGFIYMVIIALLIGGSWWYYEYQKYGMDKIKEQLNLNVLQHGTGFSDPTMKYYTLSDFIVSPQSNSTDNSTGVGMGVFALALLGFVRFLKERKDYQILGIALLIFGVLGVMSNYLPVSLVPSRFWAFMSIPLALIAGEALSFIVSKKELGIVGFMAIVALLAASGYPKFMINTSTWGSARFFTPGDYAMVDYVMNNTVAGEKAFDACMYERVWSMNLWEDPLDRGAITFKNIAVNKSKYGWDSEGWLKLSSYNKSRIFSENVTYVSRFMRAQSYVYMFVNSRCIYNGVPEDIYKKRIGEFDSSPLFEVFFKQGDERVYKMNEEV